MISPYIDQAIASTRLPIRVTAYNAGTWGKSFVVVVDRTDDGSWEGYGVTSYATRAYVTLRSRLLKQQES